MLAIKRVHIQSFVVLFFFMGLLFHVNSVQAQTDCQDAIVVCGNSGYQNLGVSGFGTQEVSGNNACSSQENNSIWFNVTVATAGTLAFTLTPESTSILEDYDFFIFGPNVDCNNLGFAIRCSTTNPNQAGLTSNLTGLSDSETDTSEGPGTDGNSFVSSINVNAGDQFYLVIDRPIGTSNFSLQWTGTATFNDPPVNSVPVGGGDIQTCDRIVPLNDGFTEFDLTANDAAFINGQANVRVSYHTSEGAAIAGTNAIPNPANFQNVVNPQVIFVRLYNELNDCFVIDRIRLNVDPAPPAGVPENLIACDRDGDGLELFDLVPNSNLVANGIANTNVTFHTSQADAISGSNPVSNSYTNQTPFTQEVLWARLEDLGNGCFDITSFTLDVFRDPVIAQPTAINQCDVDNDGFFSFDFSALKDTEVLNGLDPTEFDVFYYETAADALANTNALTFPYTNPTAFSTQQIHVRVENILAPTTCFATTFFEVSVTSLPVPMQPTNYEICDDDSDGDDTNGIVQNFILSTKDTEILGALDPSLYEVTYHLSAVEADTNSNPIDKVNPYANTSANTQTVFVRVTNVNNVDCYDALLSFDLIVHPLPMVTPLIELRQCDTDTDGFSLFNLNEAAQEISMNFANETFTFYTSLADAQNGTNAIVNTIAYQNQTVTTDQVWARTTTVNSCYRISEIALIVSTTGIPSTFQRTFNACDDFLDINGDDNANNDDMDGITEFNFSSVTMEVENLFPPTQQLIIAYYRNEADALAEQNAIADPSNYRNIGYPNTQQIYIRVDSQLDNDCLGLGPFITLNVDPVPVAAGAPNLELCDDDTDGDAFNGIAQGFDLDAQTANILGTQDPANFTVTYHTSLADAQGGINAITNTSNYQNIVANQQGIFVRMVNNTTGCFSFQTTFDLIVNPLPIANAVPDLEVCDDDSDGSAQNGFAQTFDLESQTATILGGQDPTQFSVTYHASLSDAELGILPLVTPFSNSIPDRQTIYVRVFNSTTQCANGITTFDVIVNPEPMANDVSNLSFCDDDADGDDTNGVVQGIILDDLIPDILGSQNPDDYTVTFHEVAQSATDGIAPISSPYENRDAFQQTIFVRVQNNLTGCVNDDLTFDIIVNPLPEFEVNTPQIVCLNLVPLTLEIERSSAVYDYTWTDPNGDSFFGPELDVTFGGTYQVTATTTDGTNCSRTREIVVNESNIATITENDVTIVDDSENNSIAIDPTNLGIGDYEYALQNEDTNVVSPFQDEPLFENLDGGVYTILVRDKNGCGTSTLSVPVIEFPKFFTPNNDSFNDKWFIKGANSTFFPTSEIYIFNRYGKQLIKLELDGDGWDGTYNSRPMPSDDYWFSIVISDRNGNMRERKGNFSLLRTR